MRCFHLRLLLVPLFLLTCLSPLVHAGEKTVKHEAKSNSELSYAQATSQGNICGVDESDQDWRLVQKDYAQQLADPSSLVNKILSRASAENSMMSQEISGDGAPGRYYIPVVFHVYGPRYNCSSGENCLSEEKILDALNRTNEDIRGLNQSDGPIAAEFQAIRANLDIEFVLAKSDPNGGSTNGIVRYAEEKKGYGGIEKNDEIAADAWDNFRYMNIYVMHDLYDSGETNNTGVAWYPDVSMSTARIARVVYNGDYLGSNTDENQRSILTHEFGHWLNLPHTFDGLTCSVHNEAFCAITGDNVCDTPQMAVNSALQGNKKNCVGQSTNTENFMHYSDNYAMFTQQQVMRMTAALHGAARTTLWRNDNLIATGLGEYTSTVGHPWDGSGVDVKPQGNVLFERGNLSASKGDIVNYSLSFDNNVEAVAFYLDGYQQDPDMYVSKDAVPYQDGDDWVADFISFNGTGIAEAVGLAPPAHGKTYNASVHAFSAYSNATFQVISVDDKTLCDGCERVIVSEKKDLSGVKDGTPKSYQFSIPEDATKTVVVMPGGYSGDPDMYVSEGSVPNTTTFDCGPFSAPGLSEYCEFDKGGEFNVLVVPFLDYSNAGLSVYYERPKSGGNGNTILQNGVAKILEGAQGSQTRFTFEVPENAEELSFTMASGSGDADLYVRYGEEPTLSVHDCRPYLGAGRDEVCSITPAQAGTYHVMIVGYRAFTQTSIVASYTLGGGGGGGTTIVDACAEGLPYTRRIDANAAMCLEDTSAGRQVQMSFFVEEEFVGRTLRIRTEHGTGNGDIYHRHGSRPRGGDYDNTSNGSSNKEIITVNSAKKGWHYIHVRAADDFSGLGILVDYL